jgi:hypothetical protein
MFIYDKLERTDTTLVGNQSCHEDFSSQGRLAEANVVGLNWVTFRVQK